MKRGISTVLVILVLMNVMGYYGLLVGLQFRNAQSLKARLDLGQYSDQETRSVKVFTPGNPGSEQFTRIDGEFEQDGQVFRLVKQRLYKDTFHIVFIKDETGTLIKHALADYARSFSEKSQDDDNQLIILPVFLREYLQGNVLQRTKDTPLICEIIQGSFQKVFIDDFIVTVILPPERA